VAPINGLKKDENHLVSLLILEALRAA